MSSPVLKILLLAYFWAPLFGAPVQPEWIDMTHPFNNETMYWPGLKPFKHTLVFANESDTGVYYSLYDYSASEHVGTHIDAPEHFAREKWTTDQIPLDRLIGQAVKVDISAKAEMNPDAQLMVSDLESWEQEHGKIPDGAILLMFSGWGKYWPNRKNYLGTDTNDTSMLHFPGFHPNASRWLVENRQIKTIGVDTASLDYGQSKLYESHQIFAEANIPGLEDVAHMDKLPAKGATLYAAPILISGGSGGPCRIFARLEKNEKKGCTESDGVRFKSGTVILGLGVFLAVFVFL